MRGKSLGTASLTGALLLACAGGSSGSVGGGDGGTGGGGSGTGALTADAFAKQYCAFTTPCCTKFGVTSDPEGCAIAVSLGYVNGAFDADAGRRCLDALRGLSATATFCSDGGGKSAEDSCGVALAPTGTGTKAPGMPCETSTDCAPSPEGRTQCFGEAGARACQVEVRAKEGDACVATKRVTERFAGVSSLGLTDPSRAGVCFESDDLYCAGSSLGKDRKCQKRVTPGGDCSRSENGACAGAAQCDAKTFTCKLLLAVGAACVPGSYTGAIGTDDPCVRNSYCDGDSKVCAVNVAPGGPCSRSAQCGTTTGASCEQGTCRAAVNAFRCFY